MKRIFSAITAAALVLAFAACDNPLNGEQYRYDISVSVNDSTVTATAGLVFDAAVEGYGAVEPFTVTVKNTGNQATGGLTASLSGGAASSFTLSGGTIAGIPAGESRTFTLGPNTGLTAAGGTAGTYSETVTVSGGNGIGVSFPVSFTVNARPPDYGIALSKTGTHTFTGVNEGYAAVTSLEVTVTNAGTNATGELTVALSGNDEESFTLSAASIESIGTGGSDTFTVGPIEGLTPEDESTAKTYTATVTVSGDNGITASFTVNFTVSPEGTDPDPVYGIELNVTGTHTFTGVNEGYTQAETLIVTVTNTGTNATGKLTVALSGDNDANFTLSGSSIANILVDGSDTFTVGPNTGLTPEDENTAKTYTATVTVSNSGNSITASFGVSFTVYPEGIDPPPVYSIELDKTGTHTFDSAPAGYEAITPLTVTVSNTGNRDTGVLTVALSGTGAGSFAFSGGSETNITVESIPVGGTGTFTIGPNTGLAAETYEATVTVSGGNSITASFGLSFTVMGPFITTAAAEAYLSQVQGGTTPDDPVLLPVKLEAGNWAALLEAIQTAEKFVALDISTGAMMGVGTGTEFDPGAADTGERYIVSLVLPDAAQSIKAGSFGSPVFIYFKNNLREVTGANIKTIGGYAFVRCTSLTTLDFPAARTIDDYAFYGCTALTPLDLRAAETIGRLAFYGCTSLTTLDLPAAVTIDEGAFEECTALETVSFPASLTSITRNPFQGCKNLTTITVDSGNQHFKVQNRMLLNIDGTTLIAYPSASGEVIVSGITSIGHGAFEGCTALTKVELPAVETIGHGAFKGCTALTKVELPAVETIGDGAFYGCTGLTTLNLPAAKIIGPQAFYRCTGLTTLDLPAAETIDYYAFLGCTGLTTVSLGAKAPTLGYGIFYMVNAAKTVTVKVPFSATGYGDIPATYSDPDTTETWGNGFRGGGWTGSAFTKDSSYINSNITLTIMEPFTTTSEAATYLSQVQGGTSPDDPVPLPVMLEAGDWPALLEAIQGAQKNVALDLSAGAMMGVGTGTEFDSGTASTGKGYIVSLVLPDAAQSLKGGTSSDGSVFRYFAGLREVTGANIKTIGNFAFYNCKSLTKLDLPALETIDQSAFHGCTSLTTLDLPAVKTISYAAFSGCTGLTTLDLPASLTSIDGSAFRYCVNLINLTVDSGNQYFKVENGMLLNKDGTTLIAYPSVSGAVTVSSITSLGYGAFLGCTSLTMLDLPAAVTIGYSAFYDCTSLTTLNLPAAETISGMAFYGSSLTALDLPAAVTIDGEAFDGCTKLTKVELPLAETIGGEAFDGCTGLTTVSLGAAAPKLGYRMFRNVTKAMTVTVKVPSGATGYGDIPKTYSGDDTEVTWGNGFRGAGWDGSAFTDSGEINTNITLTIQYEGSE